MGYFQYSKSLLISLGLGLCSLLYPLEARSAERISISYPPFGEFYLNVKDLNTLATEGKITSELAYFTNRLQPKQVDKLQYLLTTPLELNPLTIYKFSTSTVGEKILENLGKGIRYDHNRNGFLALRGALIQSAFSPEGLTIINILQNFPLETIYIDLQLITRYLQKFEYLFRDRQLIAEVFIEQNTNINNKQDVDANLANNISIVGKYPWKKFTLTYRNPNRPEEGYFDFYLPQVRPSVPVIVISHGLASSRRTFAYLAKHLVSHGFAVAVIEHPDTSLDKFDRFLSGKDRLPEPNNLIQQPLDVKYVLDKLEQESETNPNLQNRLNLNQIGAIGQSLGGYTVLALGGARLDRAEVASECQEDQHQDILLDLSSLARCTFNELPPTDASLSDSRIKAVLAINPLGKIFGQQGMSQLQIPTAIVSGINDVITPPVAEQMRPFTWLEHPDKYLILVDPGTHFSFLEEGIGVLPVPDTIVGPSSRLAHPALKGISTAFFKTYIAQQPEYRLYLSRDRISLMNSDPFKLSIIRSLTETQLEEAIERQLY